MKLPQIQIRTTDIKMDWQTQAPTQHIKQPQAEMSIFQPAAILDIETTLGKLSIDSSDARRDLGQYPTGEMIERYAQAGKQAAASGVSRRAQEGRQMMLNAGKGQEGAVIQQIAKQNTGPTREGPYGIQFIPSIGSVKINYQPSKVNINITRNKPQISIQANKVIHNYTPGKIAGTMIQRPGVDIDVIL